MPRDKQRWKKLTRQGPNKGGNVYVPKMDLEKLSAEVGLDLSEQIEYKITTGTSDGRGRLFVEVRNAEDP